MQKQPFSEDLTDIANALNMAAKGIRQYERRQPELARIEKILKPINELSKKLQLDISIETGSEKDVEELIKFLSEIKIKPLDKKP